MLSDPATTPLIYATGNRVKFQLAATMCAAAGFELRQHAGLDMPEIQAADGGLIARDKADQTFGQLKRPLVISDDSWFIPGLKGFPGPYMKYINDWFSPQDWLNLTRPLADRRIILRQTVIYQDENGQQQFERDLEGFILHDARGTSDYPHNCITSFDGGAHSDAEKQAEGQSAVAHLPNVWQDFAAWYTGDHLQTGTSQQG